MQNEGIYRVNTRCRKTTRIVEKQSKIQNTYHRHMHIYIYICERTCINYIGAYTAIRNIRLGKSIKLHCRRKRVNNKSTKIFRTRREKQYLCGHIIQTFRDDLNILWSSCSVHTRTVSSWHCTTWHRGKTQFIGPNSMFTLRSHGVSLQSPLCQAYKPPVISNQASHKGL